MPKTKILADRDILNSFHCSTQLLPNLIYDQDQSQVQELLMVSFAIKLKYVAEGIFLYHVWNINPYLNDLKNLSEENTQP